MPPKALQCLIVGLLCVAPLIAQHLTLAVGARGDNRDQLLKAGTYSFTITVGAESKTFENLRPTQTRRIKAEGADFVLSVLKGAQVNSGEAESLMSVVSIALFDLDWVAPVNSNPLPSSIPGRG